MLNVAFEVATSVHLY